MRCGLFLLFVVTSIQVSAQVPESVIERLKNTNATNIEELLSRKDLSQKGKIRKFQLGDPYADNVSITAPEYDEVCAVRFIEGSQTDYKLRDFTSKAYAEIQGYTVTHYGRCGACSSLYDLAIYIEKPNLKEPAKRCSMRIFGNPIKNCYLENIGFSELCAEAWTYNSINTRQKCGGICLDEYGDGNKAVGIWRILNESSPDSFTEDPCVLTPCLACDEKNSGLGFKHIAGRIRRNSGIDSAIPRCEHEVRSDLDHTAYWPSEF
jgi:hypothetical protein